MNDRKQQGATAEKLWGIANQIRDHLESGKTPDATEVGAMAIAIGILATEVEKLASDRDGKDARLRAVLALCSRAERDGITSGGTFTVQAVRAAATEQ
ncbi:hypothetical protein [Streptomyces decoyicus]|uniref:hypothetical protein n=1 Tax=Streptomyces decoyicus TaxID=249567 RepID=UPI002F90D2E1